MKRLVRLKPASDHSSSTTQWPHTDRESGGVGAAVGDADQHLGDPQPLADLAGSAGERDDGFSG